MNLTFRDANESDLPSIVALIVDDEIGQTRELNSLPEEYVRAFAAMSKSPDNRFVLAELDGALAGCLQLTYVPGLSHRGATRALVETVRVASNLRGQKIGTALMRYAIEEARKAGCGLVQLTSDNRRARAHLFYRRLGFVQSHFGFRLKL